MVIMVYGFFLGGGFYKLLIIKNNDYFLLKLPLDSFIFIINNKPNFFIITSIVNLVHLFGLLII